MSNDVKADFWDFKSYSEAKWLKSLILFLLSIAGLYLVTHLAFKLLDNSGITNYKLGYEYSSLSDVQKQLINRIYFDTVPKEIDSSVVVDTSTNSTTKTSSNLSLENKHDKALLLINNEFNNKVDPEQLAFIKQYLKSATDLEAVGYLDGARLQVKSYFWLTGPAVYFEIIFWAIFGVLCSILFSLGIVGKASTTIPNDPQSVFDSSEIPYQIAKILYAPLCTLVIVLGWNFFNDANIADISSGKGVIVFAFIGGFYSSRVIALLDRLKEVVLPSSANSTSPGTKGVNVQSPPPQEASDTYDPKQDTPPPPPSETDLKEGELPEDDDTTSPEGTLAPRKD